MSRITRAGVLLVLLAACNQRDDAAVDLEDQGEALAEHGQELDEQGEELAICDGVHTNLLIDNDNCGECGRECYVWYADTPYTAGGCANGECGAVWAGPYPAQDDPESATSCEERCQYSDRKCVARGCAGSTSLVCRDGCHVEELYDLSVVEERTGSCDEPMVASPTIEDAVIACCCEQKVPSP